MSVLRKLFTGEITPDDPRLVGVEISERIQDVTAMAIAERLLEDHDVGIAEESRDRSSAAVVVVPQDKRRRPQEHVVGEY